MRFVISEEYAGNKSINDVDKKFRGVYIEFVNDLYLKIMIEIL